MHIWKYLISRNNMGYYGNKKIFQSKVAQSGKTWTQAHPASLELRDHFSLWSALSTSACSCCWHRLEANKIWAIMYLMMEEDIPKRPQLLLSRLCGQQAVRTTAQTKNNNLTILRSWRADTEVADINKSVPRNERD